VGPDGDGGGLLDGLGQPVHEPGVELFVGGGSSWLPINAALLDDAIHGAHGYVQGGADGPGGDLGGGHVQDAFVFRHFEHVLLVQISQTMTHFKVHKIRHLYKQRFRTIGLYFFQKNGGNPCAI